MYGGGPESTTQLFLFCDKSIAYERPAEESCVLFLNDSTLELRSYSITDIYTQSQLEISRATCNVERVTKLASTAIHTALRVRAYHRTQKTGNQETKALVLVGKCCKGSFRAAMSQAIIGQENDNYPKWLCRRCCKNVCTCIAVIQRGGSYATHCIHHV